MSEKREELMAAIREAETRVEQAEVELSALGAQFDSTDENGVGVRVSYDYDHEWIVVEMR